MFDSRNQDLPELVKGTNFKISTNVRPFLPGNKVSIKLNK